MGFFYKISETKLLLLEQDWVTIMTWQVSFVTPVKVRN